MDHRPPCGPAQRHLEATFTLKWRIGLRTAVLMVVAVARLDAAVRIEGNGRVGNAKSLLDLGLLRATAGTKLNVVVDGPEATVAMGRLRELLTRGIRLGRCPHQGCESAPALLGYTRRSVRYGCAKRHEWEVFGRSHTFILRDPCARRPPVLAGSLN